MEIGRSPSIAPSAVATQPSATSSSQAQNVLPELQTVTPVSRIESTQLVFREIPVRSEQRSNQDAEAQAEQEESREEFRLAGRDREVRREIEVDRDNSALIFRSIDIDSGDIIRQFPEEARLNLRRYVEEIVVENNQTQQNSDIDAPSETQSA